MASSTVAGGAPAAVIPPPPPRPHAPLHRRRSQGRLTKCRAAFRAAWEGRILPAADAHRPDLVIVSAGFDGHRRDPLATLGLETEDYVWVTRKIMDLAEAHAQGRVVSLLEGGYDLAALAEAAGAHVRELMRG